MTPPPSDRRSQAGSSGTPTEEPTEPAPVEASEPTTTAGVAAEYPTSSETVAPLGPAGRRPRRSGASSQTAPLATDPDRLADLRRVGRGRGRHRLVLQCEPLDDRRDHKGGRHDGGGPAGRGLLRPQGPCRERDRGCDSRSVHRRPRVRDVLRRAMPSAEFPARPCSRPTSPTTAIRPSARCVGKPYADSELAIVLARPDRRVDGASRRPRCNVRCTTLGPRPDEVAEGLEPVATVRA